MSTPRTKFHVTLPGVEDGVPLQLLDHLSSDPETAVLSVTAKDGVVVVDTEAQARLLLRGFPGATYDSPPTVAGAPAGDAGTQS